MAKPDSPKCGGKLHKRDGACTLPAGWGTDHVGYGRCRKHFGNAPNVIKAAENERIDRQARKALEGISDFAAITDPVERLQLLAGRAERFMTIVAERVEELTSIRYSTDEGGEQLRAEVTIYERAMTATGRLLVDLARLGLDERSVRVQEAQVAILAGALAQALGETDLSPEQRQAITVRVAELVDQADSGVPAPRRLSV